MSVFVAGYNSFATCQLHKLQLLVVCGYQREEQNNGGWAQY